MRHPQFHRIRRLPPYVFSEVNTMKAAARAAGHDIIDLGMGNPDSPTPQPIVDKLVEAIRNPRTHRYSTSRGIPGLRRAQAAYYQRRFGVRLDPESVDARVAAAVGRFDKDSPSDAFSRLGPLARDHPDAAVVRYHLGLLLLWLANLDEARKQLTLARDAEPEGFYGRQADRLLTRLAGIE